MLGPKSAVLYLQTLGPVFFCLLFLFRFYKKNTQTPTIMSKQPDNVKMLRIFYTQALSPTAIGNSLDLERQLKTFTCSWFDDILNKIISNWPPAGGDILSHVCDMPEWQHKCLSVDGVLCLSNAAAELPTGDGRHRLNVDIRLGDLEKTRFQIGYHAEYFYKVGIEMYIDLEKYKTREDQVMNNIPIFMRRESYFKVLSSSYIQNNVVISTLTEGTKNNEKCLFFSCTI